MSERDYERGHRAAMRMIMMTAVRELDPRVSDDPAVRLAILESEVHDARNALRELCEELGCNDWPDSLHLADVIEKHLGRHLSDDGWRRIRWCECGQPWIPVAGLDGTTEETRCPACGLRRQRQLLALKRGECDGGER